VAASQAETHGVTLEPHAHPGRDLEAGALSVGLLELRSRVRLVRVRFVRVGLVWLGLVGFRFEDGLLPPGTPLASPDRLDRELSRVTSAAVSARLGPIGLGVASFEAADGATLVSPAEPARRAIVTGLPFPPSAFP